MEISLFPLPSLLPFRGIGQRNAKQSHSKGIDIYVGPLSGFPQNRATQCKTIPLLSCCGMNIHKKLHSANRVEFTMYREICTVLNLSYTPPFAIIISKAYSSNPWPWFTKICNVSGFIQSSPLCYLINNELETFIIINKTLNMQMDSFNCYDITNRWCPICPVFVFSKSSIRLCNFNRLYLHVYNMQSISWIKLSV